MRRRRIVLLPEWTDTPLLAVGFAMLAVGQATRTMAMAHAGSNFNHLVQSTKKQGHELVTDGIYAWLRHPSYFGFWCWGLGTQLVLGNRVCLVGYAVVLWRFFSRRIVREWFCSFSRRVGGFFFYVVLTFGGRGRGVAG